MYIPLEYASVKVARYFADFLVENKIVLELKIVPELGYANVKQALRYLQCGNFRLGILIYFTREGVKYRRIINSKFRN